MTLPLDRRRFLTASSTLLGSVFLGGAAACTRDDVLGPALPTGGRAAGGMEGDLADPPLIRGSGGTLSARIGIATHPETVAGKPRFSPVTYGGSIPGPTLRANAGDRLDLTFSNRIMIGDAGEKPGYGRPPRPHSTATNVHYHGLHVTPIGTGDNMTLMIEAGSSFRYSFQLPPDHPAGLFWYHPHLHGLVTNQLGRGASGMLYVANGHTAAVDALYRRRILVLQQIYLEPDLRTLTYDDGSREDPSLALTVLNGELMPTLAMRPAERQVWCVANASTSAFYQLRFPDGFGVRVLAYDGLTRSGYPGGTGPVVQIAPGKRVELEVAAPGSPGSAVLSLDRYFQGVDAWPAKPLATIAVTGAALPPSAPVPLDPAGLPDLSAAPVARSRRIVFDQDDSVAEGEFGRFRMYLEGSTPHAWDPAVPEWTDSILGTVEEWTILNETAQEHPFHVHTNPVQVMRVVGSVNGGPPPEALVTGFHDTVVVPPYGHAVVRTRFTDFTGGPILMHCHILDHEDMGMMTSFYIRD
jgi:FtsP/CotA-like multicopper oxidase with cupredoxin domain